MLKPLGPGPSQQSASETFGDLVFCALIVLVLFVLALSIEVSQRVRAASVPVEVVKPEEVATLSPEEIAELSRQLQEQNAVIGKLRNSIEEQRSLVSRQVAALAGEQRFTGAREPADLHLGVDYVRDRFYFVPSRDIEHADKRRSGESDIEYAVRKRIELTAIARRAKFGRGYTLDEAKAIYGAFTQYTEIIPTNDGYESQQSQVGITYSTWLSDKLSLGFDSGAEDSESLVVAAIFKVYANKGPPEESMYPRVTVEVAEGREALVGGVALSARDLRDILISISGRGAMLDLEGIDGPAPEWLREGALTPAGYIGKVPKRPE